MRRVDDDSPVRLLTRLFLRRLVDNDLISPHADRHESLAVLYAAVVALSVFVTFLITTDYLAAFVQLPGPTALSALADRFLFISASIAICALAALMVWDALTLESRDAAMLGALPIPTHTITRAKLAAAGVFGTVVAIGLNAVPSLLYPLFLTLNMRGTRGGAILRLIAGHAISVIMAGLFGFFGVLAIRGVVHLTLRERGFRRVSSLIQSALVVGAVTALLLAPTVRAGTVRAWVSGASAPRWPAQPSLWFLGVNERFAGYVVAETAVVLPPRFSFIRVPHQQDAAARTAYRDLLPPFTVLARRAWLSTLGVVTIGLVAFLLNNRRLPDRSSGPRHGSRLRTTIGALAERLTRGNDETQAGFFFTWQTLTRSAPHRTVLAVGVAGGLTHLLIAMATRAAPARQLSSMPLGLFAIEIVVLVSLVTAFRYAVTLPPEVASNWTIRLAWRGDERAYLDGVKRAALLMLVALPLLVLLPFHVVLFGFTIALVHALYGFVLATVALHTLFLTYRSFPFACSYVPVENPKLVWPAGVASLLLVAYAFADIERRALQTPPRMAALGATLAAVLWLVTTVDRARRRDRRPVDFDERPAPATQRLNLFDYMATHE